VGCTWRISLCTGRISSVVAQRHGSRRTSGRLAGDAQHDWLAWNNGVAPEASTVSIVETRAGNPQRVKAIRALTIEAVTQRASNPTGVGTLGSLCMVLLLESRWQEALYGKVSQLRPCAVHFFLPVVCGVSGPVVGSESRSPRRHGHRRSLARRTATCTCTG
jgi:hypothetical protein